LFASFDGGGCEVWGWDGLDLLGTTALAAAALFVEGVEGMVGFFLVV
jgi:hypothetical protein